MRARTNPTSPARPKGRLLAAAATLAALVSLVSLVAAPLAAGSRSQTTLFDLGGAGLDVPEAQLAGQLDQLQDFGVDTVRVIVTWRDIAPDNQASSKPNFDASDPSAYPQANFAELDNVVKGARSRGMNVLLTPSGPAPRWASDGDGITNPNSVEFGKFVQALGTRYSGNYSIPPVNPTDPPNPVLPRVDHWSVWNEPNLTLFLKPQLRHGKSVSGKLYRSLFLAAQDGLKASGHGSDPLLIGETSPGPGRQGTDPISFMRSVFCLNTKFKKVGGCAPIDADGWAQHPYDPFDAPFEAGKGLINLATIGDLSKALKKARVAHATTSKLPIYVTEYGVESVPDRKFGVSQLQQAEYLSISEYLMYRNPSIRSYGQYLMQDDAGNAQVNFQTGLRFSDGTKKLSYNAFAIALVAQQVTAKRHRVKIWGHVRPKGGPYTVTVKGRGGGASGTIKTIRTSAGGYFQFSTPFRKGRRYSASTQLSDGTQLVGPYVRSYVFK
jgi:hypothetical protein